MATKDKCVLCGLESEGLPRRQRKNELGISCERCGDYYIDGLLVECGEPSNKEGRAILSGYTRWEKEIGNPPPEIHAQNIDELIKRHKDLSVEEKVDKILLYYSKKSPEKGKYITYDTKMDYPIAFSCGSDEYWYFLSEETFKTFGFIDIKARDILTITPEGWRRVGLIERMNLADKKFLIEEDKIGERLEREEAEKKEQAGLRGTRYSSGLARQLGELYLNGSFEKLNLKVEIDKSVILKVASITEPADINFIVKRIIGICTCLQ